MLSKFSVKKPFTVLVAVIVIIVFGCVSYTKMTPDLFPSINMPYAVVMTTYPGASGEEVENEVTDPVEEQLASLNNLKDVMSISNDSYSMIIMEFSEDANMDTISTDIREKIDLISGSWDESIGEPVIIKMNPDMMPVAIAAVSVEGMDETEASAYVEENLMAKLEGVEGVASISTTGMISEDIQVVLSQDKIDEINEKTSNAILSQFGSAKSQISDGLSQAKSGQKKVESGKEAITEAQESAAVQMEAARVQMKEQKEQLETLKETAAELDVLRAAASAGDQASAQKLAAMEAALKQQGLDPDSLTVEIVQAQIDAIDTALSNLNIQQAQTSSALSNNMSELTATESTLQSTISQLQSALEEVQTQQEAAIASANLTGILTMDNVSAILSAQNFSMPAGYVSDGSSEILVSVGDKITDIDEMKNLVLLDMGIDGVDPVKVSDIADVTYVDNAAETYAKINGEDGILLSFSKQSGYATAEVADAVAAEFEELSAEHEGVSFTMLYDQGTYIHMVINSVLENLLLGAVFAILILWFFLRDIRPTLITAVSIPISVIFAVALMYFSGVSLNMISLAGLAVGVGMLVDNSIVVIENIYRLRSLGYNNIQAAISGAGQVAGAITASTLTTICVFLPIVFIDGMTREIFTDMALTIGYSLVASLIIALTLVPAMARGLLKKGTQKAVLQHDGKSMKKYRSIVEYCLDHRKLVIIVSLVLLVGSCGLALSRGFTYMPEMASTELSVTIQMPEESELEDTAEVTDKVSAEILKHDAVDTVGAMLASDMASSMGLSMGDSKDVTSVTMYVLLKDGQLDQADQLKKDIEAMGETYGCEITAAGGTDIMSMLGGSGVQINVYNDDLQDLRKAGMQIESALASVDGLTEISDLNEDSTPKMQISINKNKAMSHGLTVAQVYMEIAGELSTSETATSLVQNGQGTDVVVSSGEKDTMTKSDLENMELTVTKTDGTTEKIKLTSIADISEENSLNMINHQSLKRVVSVSASLKDGYNITHVTSDAEKVVDNLELPEGTTVEFQGENETIMEAMQQMVLMMVLGILLVYLVMVAQFQSLRSPFIIMFTVPLAFTGGMLALLITGNEVSVVALLGFVMLVGIIVNNGIVLVDCINQFRLEDGMDMRTAIVEAGVTRIRPVLMTAATTILGLLPLAFGMGEGAEIIQPVAIVCIGGLLYATLMTLIVVPVMYSLLSKKHMEKIKAEDMVVVDA